MTGYASDYPTTDGPLADARADEDAVETREERRRRYRGNLVEKQKGNGVRLKEFLRRKRDYYRALDADARAKRLQDVDRMVRYYNGDQYGDYNSMGVYEPYTLQDGDFAYTVPLLNAHVDQAAMMLLKTKPEYVFAPKGSAADSDRRALAAMCQRLAKDDYDRLMTEDVRQEEILWTIIAGESYRCLYWGASGRSAERPRIREGERELASGGRRYTAVDTGETEEVPVGENKLYVPNPVAVQRDFSAPRLEASSFLVVRDRVARHRAEWEDQSPVGTGHQFSEESEAQARQQRSGQQTDAEVGSARSGDVYGASLADDAERTRIWMDVCEYGYFYFDQDERTPDGKTIRAGRLFGEWAPDGLYVRFMGDEIVEIRPRRRRRSWSVVLYGKRPGTGRGAGLQNLIALQDILNDTFNLDYSIQMTSARPMTAVYRPSVRELPESNQFIFVDRLPPNGSLDSVIKQWPGQTATGVLGVTGQRIEQAMQFIGGTQSAVGVAGAPDARAMGTATGIMAVQENAAGRMAPAIGQRVTADIELNWQILENIQDFSDGAQRKELERRFGPDVVRAFFEADLRRELVQTVAQGTDRPQSAALTQASLESYALAAQALAQVPGGSDVLAQMAEVMGLPISVGEGRSDRAEAEHRLNKLRSLEEKLKDRAPALLANAERAAEFMYGKLAKWCAPLVAAPAAVEDGADAPQLFMQEHAAFMDVYRDWLFGEESRVASEALRLVVIRLWQDHFEAAAVREFKMADLRKRLLEVVSPPEPVPTPEEQEAARGAALEEEALRLQAGEAQKDADAEREMLKAEHASRLRREEQAEGEVYVPAEGHTRRQPVA